MKALIAMSPAGEVRDPSGFTLIELMVVLAVLALALALAMPTLGRLMPGLELQTEARDVASALREARAQAIGQNAEVAVVVNAERRAVLIGDRRVVQLTSRAEILPAANRADAGGSAGPQIRFFPDGSSSGGQVTLLLDERKRHVLVDWLTGAISVAE